MYRLVRPLLFRLDAETAHGVAMRAVGAGQRAEPVLRRMFSYRDERLGQTLWGHRFANPVGLAAGFDKNAAHIGFWPALGFGFCEVGSVTARPSRGNLRPRAFRLPDDRALVNRMGLNNDGAAAVAERLAAAPRPRIPLGINVAKTHDPGLLGAAALDDFREAFRALAPLADYVALNVSCPNTAEGKTFEEPEALDELLGAVMRDRAEVASSTPVLVKLSPPGLSPDFRRVETLVAVARAHGVAGFIATNTASDRVGLASGGAAVTAAGAGGLSGRPLAPRATALVRHLYRTTGGALPIIGVGGIDSAEAAYARIRAGASLVQVYTGLVYEGPWLVRRINRGLTALLAADGFSSIAEAVGADVPGL